MLQLGPRIWKTSLAVGLGVFLARLLGLYEVYVCLAAAAAIAPTVDRTWKTAMNQILINVMACVVGGVAILVFGTNPVVIGVAICVTLYLWKLLNVPNTSDGVLSATLFVLAPHPGDHIETYLYLRFISILLGVVMGVLINHLLMPPKYADETLTAIKAAGDALDDFLLKVTDHLTDPQAYAKPAILAASGLVQTRIAEAQHYLHLTTESRQNGAPWHHDAELLERCVRVLSSLLERMLVIHKSSLSASQSPGYQERILEFQIGMRELVSLRQSIYSRLYGGAREEMALPQLEELAGRFELPPAPPAGPTDIAAYFQRHHMRSSLSESATSLSRLYLAMDRSAENPAA